MDNEVTRPYPDINLLKSQIVPIQSDDIMAEAGRKLLLVDLIQMLEHEPGSRSGDNIEHLHQMRVAARRMRSVFSLLADYYKAKPIRLYIQQLRTLGKQLGAVRDMDVMIENLSVYQQSLNEVDNQSLQVAIDYLKKWRRKARKKLNAFLDSNEYRDFINDFSEFLTHTGSGIKSIDTASAAPYQVRHVLPPIIHDHLATVRAYDTVLLNGNLKTFHALRIEFKRLRYIVSYFADILGNSVEGFISDLKEIQDYLGRLNDLVVAQEKLETLKNDLPDNKVALQVINDYIETLKQEEMDKKLSFQAVWEKFNTRTVQRKLSDSLLVLR